MSPDVRSPVIPRGRSKSITTRRTSPNTCAITDYANSMFRFERLNERWLENCAAYVTHLFGKSIVGATVIDYAFGRGNWSIAFRRAGASRVVAVDASIDNVRRFREYCAVNKVSGIDVIHGNILERRIDLVADLVWVYGVLHHVREAKVFVKRLVTMTRDPGSLLYFYAYDAGSLRQFIVETSRKALPLRSERAFRRVSLNLTPPARLRARDDLTAPYIRWYSVRELAGLLRREGLYVMRQDADFQSFLEGVPEFPEFSPHQFLCSLDRASGITVAEVPKSIERDIGLLSGMAASLLKRYAGDGKNLQSVGVGLMNAHFSALDRKDARSALIQDYLYLLYCLMISGVNAGKLDSPARRIVQLGLRNLHGASPSFLRGVRRPSILEQYLASTTIRL